MEFSRQYLTRLAQESNFIKDTLEKVLRLSEILKFLNSDVVFKDKLALKGGTAINLTAVELPRLSVDIDLDFTVNVDSGAEDLFIDLFADTFGAEKAGYLYSQYPFFDIYQNSRFADFVCESGAKRIAIEI